MKNSKSFVLKDYFPRKITVGFFDTERYGFVTCKYKDEKWLNLGAFERLVGFKPHNQIKSEVKLKKVLAAAVMTFDNEPSEGFSICDFNCNIYNICHEPNNDILVKDPRGFTIAITLDNLYEIFNDTEISLGEGGVLKGKFIYGFSNYTSRAWLVSVNSDYYKKYKSISEELDATVDSANFLTKKLLKVGHVYNGTFKMPGKFMYMGSFDTYSLDYMSNNIYKAFKNRVVPTPFNSSEDEKPELVEYENIKDYNEGRRYYYGAEACKKGVMVFYTLEDPNIKKGKDKPHLVEFTSITRFFINEDTKIDTSKYVISENNLPATYDNVKKLIDTSFRYNRIDLECTRDPMNWKPLKDFPKELFKSFFDVNSKGYKSINENMYKFKCYLAEYNCFISYTCSSMPGIPYIQIVKPYEYSHSYTNTHQYSVLPLMAVRKTELNYRNSHSYYRTRENVCPIIDKTISAEELFNDAMPQIFSLKLENGNQLCDIDAIYLTNDILVKYKEDDKYGISSDFM